MVIVHRLPDGAPFAIVIDSDARAETSAATDESSVTVVLRKQGKMPCSLIFPGNVAEQVFGSDFARVLRPDDDDSDTGELQAFTGGGL